MDAKLRAYYIRELRRAGYRGNAGGWIFAPSGARAGQGWQVMLQHLGGRLQAFGRALGPKFCGHMDCLLSATCKQEER